MLSIGSNVGDRLEYLRGCVVLLGGVVRAVDGIRQDDLRLTLPHPRAHQRAFVLVSWLDVAPGAVLAGRGTVAELVTALPAAERRSVQRRDDLRLDSG